MPPLKAFEGMTAYQRKRQPYKNNSRPMKGTMKTTTKDGKGPHTKKQKQKQKQKKKKKGQKIIHIKGGERPTPK